MEELGDYVYARTKSRLTRSELDGGNVTHVFTGSAATADGALIDTEVRLYVGDDDGPGARTLVRSSADDLFREGSAEAYDRGYRDGFGEGFREGSGNEPLPAG